MRFSRFSLLTRIIFVWLGALASFQLFASPATCFESTEPKWHTRMRSGKLSKAMALVNKDLAPIDGQINDPAFAELLFARGSLFAMSGSFGAAEIDLRRALELNARLLPDSDSRFASSLCAVSDLLLLEGRYSLANDLAQTYKSNAREKSSLLVAACLNCIARASLPQGDVQTAGVAAERALAIAESSVSHDNALLGEILDTGAMVSLARSDFDQSQKQAEAAVNIGQKTNEPLLQAEALNILARAYLGKGELSEAAAPVQQCMSIRLRILGEQHPLVADTSFTLGVLALRQHDAKEAQRYFLQDMTIFQTDFGANNPGVAGGSFGLALTNASEGQMTEANYYFDKTLQVQVQMLGSDHPVVQEYEALYRDFLWCHHRWADSIYFSLTHKIRMRASLGLPDLLGCTLKQCIVQPQIEEYNSKSALQQMMSHPIFALLFGIMLLIGVVAVGANVALVTELVKDGGLRNPKQIYKKLQRAILKTIFGHDGKLGLRAMKEGSRQYWFWHAQKEHDEELAPNKRL